MEPLPRARRAPTQGINHIRQLHPELILRPPILPVRLLGLDLLHRTELDFRAANADDACAEGIVSTLR